MSESLLPELDGRPATPGELAALALTNYGHFTTMRVEEGGVRGLGLHLERLTSTCRRLFDAELDADRVRAHVAQALQDLPRPVVARVTVFDPALDAGSIGADAEPHVLVTTRSAPPQPCPPLRLRSAVYERDLAEVKHTAIFGAMRHRRAAVRAGFDDVVLVDAGGRLGELATANLAVIIDDQLVWPGAAVLGGVTAALIDQAHKGPTGTEPLLRDDLDRVDAAIALSSVVGVRAIASIDGRTWPDEHPLIARLRAGYDAIPPEPLQPA
jgi:branched-subunit amino acid aminotransferase/4-amino-4-deoxychorismate lyase